MKTTLRLLLLTLVLGFGLTGCFMHEARIESDYSYSGNFRHYRTYEFMQGAGLSADTSRLGQVLRDAIRVRLRQQGYRPNERRPDLLVNFRLYEGSVRFRGYNQPSLERWVEQNVVEDDETPERYRQGYEPFPMVLNDGTLMVTLVDAHSRRVVWNGYASGVEVPTGTQGEIVLRRSVRSIFDNYRVFTEGYLQSPDEQREERN
jgi:hypothetical protein